MNVFGFMERTVEVNPAGSTLDVTAPFEDCEFSGTSPITFGRPKDPFRSLERQAGTQKMSMGNVSRANPGEMRAFMHSRTSPSCSHGTCEMENVPDELCKMPETVME